MKDLKVSIIIPAYNVSKYIEKCLGSVQRQHYRNWEAIIIDDGSTDDTYSVCKDYAKKDQRFIVTHQINCGQSSARNLGIDMACGQYIAFIDSDDYVSEDFLSVLVDGMCGGRYDLSICGYSFEKEDGGELYRISGLKEKLGQRDILMRMFVPLNRSWGGFVWNKLYNAAVIKHANIRFHDEYTLFEDIAFNYEYLKVSGEGLFNPKAVYHYVNHPSSLMRSVKPDTKLGEKWLNSTLVFDNIIAKTEQTEPELCKCMRIMKTMHASTAVRILAECKLKEHPKYKEMKRFIRKNLLEYLRYRNVGMKKKLGCVLSLIAPKTAYRLWVK